MATIQVLTFRALLKRHRRASHLTQEQLAERVGYSASYLSQLERGVRVPVSTTAEALAEALALDPGERATLLATIRSQRRPAVAAVKDATSLPWLVGRLYELARLESHLASEGTPLLLLAGEPGIGKTRLLEEAALQARGHGLTVLAGGCTRRSGQEPYAPLLEALAGYVRRQSHVRLRRELEGCAWLVRLLPELADTTLVPAPSWTLPPVQERRLMFTAVGHFLANVAGAAGTLLVLDDLQWAGEDALDLLAELVRAASERPLRVVGAYRDTEVRPEDALPTVLTDLVREGLAGQMRLRPLSLDEARELLNRLLEGSPDLSMLEPAVRARAGTGGRGAILPGELRAVAQRRDPRRRPSARRGRCG